MNARTIVAAFALALSAGTHAFAADPAAQPLPESPVATIEYASPEAALAALRAKPGVAIREEQGWIVISDNQGDSHAVWTFTTQAQAAHPAVVKRTILERDGAIYIEMDVMCGGSKEDCDALVRGFQDLNERMKQELASKSSG